MDKLSNLFTEHAVICFSHLRWNLVYQRPQHLMARCSELSRVFYVEEPIFSQENDYCKLTRHNAVTVVTPVLLDDPNEPNIAQRIKNLLQDLFVSQSIIRYIFWYYTPMALTFTRDFQPALVIYDCMDELSAFKFAPTELIELEQELFIKADIVFTGGKSLYEHKKEQHHNIYPLPSSIDKEHFEIAKQISDDPDDQKRIAHPRLGYCGVIDERFDVDLIDKVADKKRGWNFIFIGPVVKIETSALPQHPNIYYLGPKRYDELPLYLAGWDVALIPFVRNQYTEFISPTKTPEYLAAGKPVISTSIKDVVNPYGINGLVKIADTSDEFIRAAEFIFSKGMGENWVKDVDDFLSGNSWNKTWTSMLELIKMTLQEKSNLITLKKRYYV
jgi:glycosyltransferase involved in cell wall biosynthesis